MVLNTLPLKVQDMKETTHIKTLSECGGLNAFLHLRIIVIFTFIALYIHNLTRKVEKETLEDKRIITKDAYKRYR